VRLAWPTFDGGLRAACLALGAWVLAGLALLSVVHLDDRYRVSHVSGVWMALAQYVGDGTLYPPLYDGERFGGTRFMPLQMLLHGGLAELTGEYLVSGKLLTLAITAALLGLTFIALRRIGAPAWLALALLALLVTTQTGLTAMTSIRGDALPVALQLAALLTVSRWTSRGGAAAAGLLCAAAMLSKISALWAPAAILVWLVASERARLRSFLGTFLAALAGALALLELGTDGRFSDNVLGLAASALSDPSAIANALTTKPLTLIDSDAAAISVVIPFALAELVLAARARTFALEHLAFVGSLLTTLVLMTDIGVVSNHLLDLEVLTLLLVGRLWVEQGARETVIRVLVPVAVLWAAAGAYLIDMHPDVKNAGRAAAGRSAVGYPAEPVTGLLPAGSSVLSEDATIAVTSGRRPTVLDPFMLLRIVERHPEWGAELVRRLDRREFGRVVLLTDHVRVDGSIEVPNPRWRREHFGTEIVAAIARNYEFRAFAGSYAVYAPRAGVTGT
jgi:hypothetical protein